VSGGGRRNKGQGTVFTVTILIVNEGKADNINTAEDSTLAGQRT
jgi:hypothetical protein